MTVQLKEAEKDYGLWDALYRFLGDGEGKKFRSMAVSMVMKELLHYANSHLRRLTGGRFELECGRGALDIVIRDAYHCDAAQTPANLSGGESFMVSLSLALGLSSMMGAGNASSDILFIDEGFGTLDVDYLDRVMQMLERLQEGVGESGHYQPRGRPQGAHPGPDSGGAGGCVKKQCPAGLPVVITRVQP